MRKTLYSLAAVLMLCGQAPAAMAQQDNAQVIATAQNDLQSFLGQIPAGQLEYFGFSSRSQFANSSLGKPYRMLGLNMDLYKGVDVNEAFAIVPQNRWRLPVLADGIQRMLLDVTDRSGKYETVAMGAAQLAAELQKKSALSSPAHQYGLLRIYPLEADFFVESNGDDYTGAKYYPLYSATMSMPVLNEYGNSSLTLSQLLPIIKDALRNHPKY